MAQQNFLGQLVQSGALKGYDPTRSVERATNIQAAQAGIESGQLTSNMKRLEIGKSALMQVQDKDDYQGYRNFMVGEIGLNQDLFPQNFADDNAFEEWKGSALLSADQIIKAQSGKPFMVHKVNPDGTKVNIKINSMDQYKRWSDAGLIDDTYSLGEVSGAPTRNEPLKTWVTPDDKIINLPNSQAPPQGSVPYSATAIAKGVDKFSPSSLKKLITERQSYIDQGKSPDDPIVKAYDDKISGTDINLEEMTQDEIDTWGAYFNVSGKIPSLGRGKQSTKVRVAIAKSAARQALGASEAGIPEGPPEQTPAEAALEMAATQADTKAIQGSLNFLDKQLSSMGSFVTNLSSQVDRVQELSKDLKTYDTRLLNIPLRAVRGRIKGSALQAKYDLYLSEIESEIGKLATGSTGSIAELSTSAQEKWAKIHDKNLSIKDMLSLLEETREAANFRVQSVEGQLNKTRERIRTRDFGQAESPIITTQEEFNALPSGAVFIEDGKQYRKP